jgi:gliding motility-associated-like protein
MSQPGDQTLNWNSYAEFIKFTENQQVLLSSDQNSNYGSTWNILNTLGTEIATYQDFTTVSINQQRICYCIRAIENNIQAPFNRKDSSYSNVECVTADPIVYFPNAIQLNGFNTVFLPQGVFIDYSKSYFLIYDRWGQLLYETNDIRKGWDGTANGELVQSDVYAYKAVIIGLNGKILNFDGTITVLK